MGAALARDWAGYWAADSAGASPVCFLRGRRRRRLRFDTGCASSAGSAFTSADCMASALADFAARFGSAFCDLGFCGFGCCSCCGVSLAFTSSVGVAWPFLFLLPRERRDLFRLRRACSLAFSSLSPHSSSASDSLIWGCSKCSMPNTKSSSVRWRIWGRGVSSLKAAACACFSSMASGSSASSASSASFVSAASRSGVAISACTD